MNRLHDNVVDRLDIEYCSLEGRLVRDLWQNEMRDSDIETVIRCLRNNIYLEEYFENREEIRKELEAAE